MTVRVGSGDDEATDAARTIGHLASAGLADPIASGVAADALDAVSAGARGLVTAG